MALTDRFGCRMLFIAGLSAIHIFRVVAAQETSQDIFGFSDPTNPQSTIYLSADGGICSWTVPLRERNLTNGLDGCKGGLLDVVLTENNTDTTDQLEWHRISGTAEFPVRFEGIGNRSGIRVLRSYAWTADSRALLRHVLRVELTGANRRRVVQVDIAVSSDIAKHVSNDRSLGDFFYGFSRIFSRPSASSESPSRITGATQADWVSVVTRHNALILRLAKAGPESSFSIEPGPPFEIALTSVLDAGPGDSAQALDIEIELTMLPLTSTIVADYDLEPLLYSDAWGPIRYLTQGIDLTLDKLSGAFGNIGVAVIFFAVLIRILFFPVTLWSMRQQKLFSAAEQAMRPTVNEINETLKGEEKSERLLALYKEHGVSPFSGLKGSVALFVQIPILLALFNVTAESAIFRDVPFLWVSDLSLPDRVAHLPFFIPMFGGSLNLLPIALGAVNLLSGSIESKQEPTSSSSNRMATIFTILILVFFYSCAAALVLYWLTVNLTQIAERQYIRRYSK